VIKSGSYHILSCSKYNIGPQDDYSALLTQMKHDKKVAATYAPFVEVDD